jgi:hypothetical protein
VGQEERFRIGRQAAARALVGLPTVSALGLMLLNDHVLKGTWPGSLTGKLSDFAFLFFAPIVVVFVMRARTWPAILGCYAIPTALFVAINVSPSASAWFAAAMSRIVPMVLWPDPTDLVALVSLPVSFAYLVARRDPGDVRRSIHMVVTGVAAFACMATSPRRPSVPPTHEPVYMSWQEFRGDAVQVLPPRPIERRGKLLIAHDHLFISEPGRGVHVFDNRFPEHPLPVMFIQIPGNIDIAVRDDRLYADSFVDLLIFELDLENRTARLIDRLENQFAYDPYQSLGVEERVYAGPIDQRRGVVIRLDPIAPDTQGARR